MKKLISGILAVIMIVAVCSSALGEGAKDTHLLGGDEFPVRFDLRDYGVVTPVKFQNPWGSCWSFGGIAAAESSILTTLGMTTEEYEQAVGKPFDLSEKHLAWFASRPITAQTEESQVGEGLYFTNKENDPTAAYDAGGKGMFVTTLFAAGVGPVDETFCPYQGAEGLTEAEFNEKYPDRARANALARFEAESGLSDLGLTLAQLYEKRAEMPDVFQMIIDVLYRNDGLDESVSAEDVTCQDLEDACVRVITSAMGKLAASGTYNYAKGDDWTIPDTAEDGRSNRDVYSGFTLVDGNILPDLVLKEDGHWAGINEAGMRAVKSELLKGRGVSIGFYADQSEPTDEIRKDGFMNLDTWAQYSDEERDMNHAVCIVGWDDNYPRENFNEGHLPEGDGAWIVKNSWGSETEYATREDGTPIGKRAWGVQNEEGLATGYFYLSYYDKNISNPETMVFDIDLMQAGGLMSVFAYDYMPALFADGNANYRVQDVNVLKTANVFTNTTDREVAVYGVSTKTANPRARVEYTMYRLKDDAKNPEDGEYLGKRLAYYDYAGFHREALVKGEIRLQPGERIAVVVTETVTDNNGVKQYEFAANQSVTRELAQMVGMPMYGVAVVNRGESFVYRDGQWTDWVDYGDKSSDVMADQLAMMGVEFSPELVATDNFSIKLYVAAEDDAQDAAVLLEQAKPYLDAGDYEAAVPMLRAAADLGNAEAQYHLGMLYYDGDGVEQDYEEAVKYYRLSAEQGYREAQCNLGFCYFDGKGVEQDYEMARKYYQLAADQGDEVALYNLGINSYFGTGMEQDYSEAYRYLCLAAEQGYPAGIFAVGECYYLGTGVEKDLDVAAEWYRKALDAGFEPRDEEETAHLKELIPGWQDATALVEQAKPLLDAGDYEAAVPLLQAAADLGDPEGQTLLAICYNDGQGVETDYEAAMKYYRMAADQGYPRGIYNVGLLYDQGQGVEQDFAEAAKYYKLAADKGYDKAQYNLACCYSFGEGVEQDDVEAAKYYKLAADQGFSEAQFNLGISYYNGRGVALDYKEAFRYFQLAADQGHPDSLYTVGECYYLGTGVEKDLKAAAEWYQKALDAGFVPRDEEETAHFNELLPDWDAHAIDYGKAILGTWEGHSTSVITANDDGREHRWEYRDDGTFVYYSKEGDKWVPADDALSVYTLEGSQLNTRWAQNDQEITESWKITINGDKMNWTALRKDEKGYEYIATFEMTRVEE